jgi:hypothetical protein
MNGSQNGTATLQRQPLGHLHFHLATSTSSTSTLPPPPPPCHLHLHLATSTSTLPPPLTPGHSHFHHLQCRRTAAERRQATVAVGRPRRPGTTNGHERPNVGPKKNVRPMLPVTTIRECKERPGTTNGHKRPNVGPKKKCAADVASDDH